MTGNNSRDKLDNLIALQTAFMRALDIDPRSGVISAGGKPSQTELGAAIGITVESAEILEVMEKASRKWKEKSGSISDEVKEELIDVIFFVLELSVLLNLSGDQLMQLYVEKYKKNLLRLLNATASKTGGVSGILTDIMDKQFGYDETERLVKEALAKKEA